MTNLSTHLELCKVRISLFAAFSALTGFLLSASALKPEAFVLFTGVLALACGSSALNQYQERETDALMPRTAKRPLPSGRMEPVHALFFSLILISLGAVTLLLSGAVYAPLLGLLAIGWYNGVYTCLKRKTAFALIPGALVGMISPAIGWVAGGGSLSDPRIALLCFFFFMWQVPHFWLLVLDHGREYESAGLPSISSIFTRAQMLRIIFVWILATAVSCLLISVTGMIHTPSINYLLWATSLWAVANGITLLRRQGGERLCSSAFRTITLYMLFVMALLSFEKVLL